MSKNNKKTAQKPVQKTERKISYSRFSFWFPILYGVVNVILMFLNFSIFAAGNNLQNAERAVFVRRRFFILCLFSPTALILLLFLHRRHSMIFSHAPAYYSKAPGIFGILVVMLELFCLISMMV